MSRLRTWAAAACCAGALAIAVAAVRANARSRQPRIVRGALEPVTTVVGSGPGGTVVEVFARQGELIHKGQLLVRLDAGELRKRCEGLRTTLRFLDDAMQNGDVLARLPSRTREFLFNSHPDIIRAENAYVDALQSFERASSGRREIERSRLDRAAADRTRVRRRIAASFARGSDKKELTSIAASVRTNLAAAEELLEHAEVRSPSDATIDLLDIHVGDRLAPGTPVAVLLVNGEFFSDIVIPGAEIARLSKGMSLNGALADSNRFFKWYVESISKRQVPVPFRENRQIADETVVRARISLARSVAPGATANLQLP